jgi:hypothetical protein
MSKKITIEKYHTLNEDGRKVYDLESIRDCFDSEMSLLEQHNEKLGRTDKPKSKKIKSVDELRDILMDNEDEGYLDFAISLNGGAFSRKEIMYNAISGKFLINNCIDDTEQDLSAKQLMNPKLTNIGEAITKGAFYQLIY